jgi:hypothetical protein
MNEMRSKNQVNILCRIKLINQKNEARHTTAVWRIGGFSASFDCFVVGSSAVIRFNFCAKNPPLHQATNS